jgi:hypothetical protein
MVLGSLMAAAGLLYLPVAIASGWAVWVFTSYLLLVVNVFSKIPGAVIAAGNISRILIVVYYASAVVIVWMLTRRQQVKFAAEMGPAAA